MSPHNSAVAGNEQVRYRSGTVVTDIGEGPLHFDDAILGRGRQVLDGHGTQRRVRTSPDVTGGTGGEADMQQGDCGDSDQPTPDP